MRKRRHDHHWIQLVILFWDGYSDILAMYQFLLKYKVWSFHLSSNIRQGIRIEMYQESTFPRQSDKL